MTIRRRPRVYFAAPFFSAAERAFNDNAVAGLELLADVFYPWRDGVRMGDLIAVGVDSSEAASRVWRCDLLQIRRCDALVAVLDGRVPDEGVCIELGLAFGCSKPAIGLLTDQRRAFHWGMNPMVTSALSHCESSVDAVLARLSEHFPYNPRSDDAPRARGSLTSR